jgi:hypothetical protein
LQRVQTARNLRKRRLPHSSRDQLKMITATVATNALSCDV